MTITEAVDVFEPEYELNSPSLGAAEPLEARSNFLFDGRIEVAAAGESVLLDGCHVSLTPNQRKLLTIFAQSPDRAIDYLELSSRLYGYADQYSMRTVKDHVTGVRNALGSELGDQETGVLRTSKKLGVRALSSADPRKIGIAGTADMVRRFADNRIETNFDKLLVRVDGVWLDSLSLKEHMFLNLLAKNSPNTVPLPDLHSVLFPGVDYLAKRLMPSTYLLMQLRQKLGPNDLGHPKQGAIKTLRHVGYQAVQCMDR